MLTFIRIILFTILTLIEIKSLYRRRKNVKEKSIGLETVKRNTFRQIELNIVHTETLPLNKRLSK
ncbi:MAG: hypothetical protein NTU73_05775, partial [Ignavibacteriae bacterium]|nr:hypothetical protein [Ignavibacteriota bacterium]